ncbi:MAG: NfeD family protein [Bacilli bacterium]|nr:NfeD family protein [Bacilli bacterium]MBO7535527.1 NfeD family protein [Bacilli bacterium]
MLTFLIDLPFDPWILIWAFIIIATVVVELATDNLVTIWFTLGAVVALITLAFGASEWIQIVTFVGSSAIFLVATRPLTKKMMRRSIIRTNADKVIGTIGIVTKPFSEGEIGEVKVDSNFWRAINLDGKSFEEGEKIMVDAITGTKLVVSKLEEENKIEVL